LGHRELKASSRKFGQLYPILVDYYGEIIDGEHRFRADRNWRKVKLEHIKTEEDRLVARIVANNVRRSVTPNEKRQLLRRLANIHLKQGVQPGRIAHRIAKETGMSYRWVVKYLPFEFKDNLQSDRASAVARCAAEYVNGLLEFSTRYKKPAIQTYSNTSFVSIIVEKSYYCEFEKDSLILGIPTEMSVLKALEDYHHKMKRLINLRNPGTQTVDFHKECKLEVQN